MDEEHKRQQRLYCLSEVLYNMLNNTNKIEVRDQNLNKQICITKLVTNAKVNPELFFLN